MKRQLLKVCLPEPIFEKGTECVSLSPKLLKIGKMPDLANIRQFFGHDDLEVILRRYQLRKAI